MTIQPHHGSGGSVARIPIPMAVDPEQEFLALLALQERTQRRLDELFGVCTGCRLQATITELAVLPLSGLVQAQPGILLFKQEGRRDA